MSSKEESSETWYSREFCYGEWKYSLVLLVDYITAKSKKKKRPSLFAS